MSKIQVTTLVDFSVHGDTTGIDMKVNDFIQSQDGIKVIDVKLTVADTPTTSMYPPSNNLHACVYYAMVIHKDKK